MNRRSLQWLRILIIWLAGAAAVFIVSSFAPSLSNASINVLFRTRGVLPTPGEIVIVAFDDQSIQQIGKYPWARSVIADGLDKITLGKPSSVGIDVIYAEESEPEEDARLSEAVRKSNRVVLPSQLFENVNEDGNTEIVWLAPLPEIESGAAGKGHAHAAPDVDGTLRSIQLSKSDDKGNRLWAFGLEVLRVAEEIPPNDFEEKPEILRFVEYNIPLLPQSAQNTEIAGLSIVRPNEMLINYIGPAKSFRYYSFADILNDKIPPETFADKIVLIGATSPTLGDAQITPFMHYAVSGELEGGQAMPGVEVHANIINTIKSRLWIQPLPEIWNYAIGLLIIFGTTLTIRRLDGWRQIFVLFGIVTSSLAGSLFAFNQYHLILPMPEMLTAFFVSVPLLLLDRSLSASRDLDLKLERLSAAQKGFLPGELTKFNEESGHKTTAILPRNLEWKLRAVDRITASLLTRMNFINQVLSGMTEGVMAADTTFRIAFVNQRMTYLFETKAENLLGRNLAEFCAEQNIYTLPESEATINKVINGEIIQKEFEETFPQIRHFLVQFSPITAAEDDAVFDFQKVSATKNNPVIGILILVFDVTKQRELDRLKTETLQLVSHELRSPLTSIQGLSDVLRKFPVSKEESIEMLETIHSEAVKLNDLINRFLDVKRLESGIQNLQIAAVDIEKLIADCAAAAKPLADEKNIKIQNKTKHSLPVLQCDEQLLIQAVGNLLSNAVKYSPPQSIVEIRGVLADSEVQIIVTDKGYGIPADALENIFRSFYRLRRDENSANVGTGLGLSFVKNVAEKHGGQITVESRENIGSTFVLHLPV